MGGLFPPDNLALGLDGTSSSPRARRKMVRAGVKAESFQAASEELARRRDLTIGPKAIERLVQRIGQERIDQRHAAVEAHRNLPLIARDDVADPTRPSPAVAMVSVDGGRLQARSSSSRTESSRAATGGSRKRLFWRPIWARFTRPIRTPMGPAACSI